MISDSSVSVLIAWHKETWAKLRRIRKEEALIREALKVPANALRQARYKGKDISWEDRDAVLKMVEDLVTGVTRVMTTRSEDLELHLDKIAKLAAAELPPGAWVWPADHETTAEH